MGEYEISFKPRLYQEKILGTAINHNTLIVLPTGLGKTNIFVMLAIARLNQYKLGKILLLGPTRPLIEQYMRVFENSTNVPEHEMCMLTGRISPDKRKKMFESASIIFSTPQCIENDILTRRISLEEVSLLGIDEAHRAVGDYSYVWIAKQYHENSRREKIVGMTASPGTDKEKIQEVMQNIFIEQIEARTHDDPDVAEYVSPVKVHYEYVNLPENMTAVVTELKKCIKAKTRSISQYLGEPVKEDMSRKDLLKMQAQLQASIVKGNRDFKVRKALSVTAEVMKAQHALELGESQGVYALKEYMEDLFQKAQKTKTQATINLVADLNFRNAYAKTLTLSEKKVTHPKLEKLKEIVDSMVKIDSGAKGIIFNNYRDNAGIIVEELNKIDGIKAKLFVGQAKKKGSGLSQKEQKEMLEKFGAGDFNFIVSTSIGEEGLDIPKVDSVIFYEPVPSAIRAIQRRGRTGRGEKGRVIILVTKGTRDEAYLWSTRHKEKRMHQSIREINKMGPALNNSSGKVNKSLKEYEKNDEGIIIYTDARERSNPVVKELIEVGVTVEMERLDVADYILSSEVAVEFKTADDFLQSIIDGRLLSQAKFLRESYKKPLMIIQGFDDIYNLRNLHPNAIRGAISAIAVDFQITILPSKNPKDTAGIMLNIARREQLKDKRPVSRHFTKDESSISRMQEYIIGALPGIGPTLSIPLLKYFKSVKNVANATKEKLSEVELIGKKKAEKIYDVFNEEYKE